MTASEIGRGGGFPPRPWLVTRPQPEAAELAEALAARGVPAIVSPALSIEPVAVSATDHARNAPIDGMIFTSRNGVRFGADLAPSRALPVFAVGEATAAEARKAGFVAVKTAMGDGRSVAALVRRTYLANADQVSKREGSGRGGSGRGPHLVHPSGAHRAVDLTAQLARDGIRVSSVTTYEAVPVDGFSVQAYGSMSEGRLAGILLFSPRTARHVAHLIAANGMDERLSGVYAVCLSGNVAEPIRHLRWRKIVVAQARTTDAMLDAVSDITSLPPPRQRPH